VTTIVCMFVSAALNAPVLAGMPTGAQYTNSIGMRFVRIEPGTFPMGFEGGRLPDELLTKKGHFAEGDFDERPRHRVRITRPFYMGVCEVTNAQYELIDPNHKNWRGRNGYSTRDDEAVVFVSWHDAAVFCKRLSDKENLHYRLPTEDDWGWNFNGRGFEASQVLAVSEAGPLKISTGRSRQFWLRTERAAPLRSLDPKKGFTAEIRTRVLARTAGKRGIDLELYDGAGSRYAITITDTGLYWYKGLVQSSSFLPFTQYVPLAQGLDNSTSAHTYRLAVRPDRVAQVYRDGQILGVRRFKYKNTAFPIYLLRRQPGCAGSRRVPCLRPRWTLAAG